MAFGRKKKDAPEKESADDRKSRRKKEREAASAAMTPPEPEDVSGVETERDRRKREKAEAKMARTFANYPFLSDFKPREKYVFHSDYFQVDKRYGTIMSFFHIEGAQDNFDAFWGVNKIATGLDDDISIILFEQVHKMTDNWVADHQNRTEGISEMNSREQGHAGTNTTRKKSDIKRSELDIIAQELLDGGAYLHTHHRVMLTASSLENLDRAVQQLSRLYTERFASLSAAPYVGEQRREMSTLFMRNSRKLGHGFYFTSQEYAGAYSLVTHGLEDDDGEYVGYMVGDVNNSAVIFNVDKYKHHVVVADDAYGFLEDKARVTSLWGSKIGQAALLENHRVAHIVLDGTDLDAVGPKMATLTAKIDMNQGDVNMFEMFGKREDQLSIFPGQMQKLILMAEQAFETNANDRAIIRGSLEEIATRYYVDNKMWYENAQEHLDRLRVVGIPHDEVPKLEMFTAYLDKEYKAMSNMTARDDEKLHALSVLRVTFKNMLSNNGDLFNTITKSNIDNVAASRRVIYDFSKLMMRGEGVAMAQLVNIIAFAVGILEDGDVVVFHGMDRVADSVKAYIGTQLAKLYDHGGRAVFLYNTVESMLADQEFTKFDRADYCIYGNMSATVCEMYQKAMNMKIPGDLARLITTKSEGAAYIRRGFDNVVFHRALSIGGPTRKKKGG